MTVPCTAKAAVMTVPVCLGCHPNLDPRNICLCLSSLAAARMESSYATFNAIWQPAKDHICVDVSCLGLRPLRAGGITTMVSGAALHEVTSRWMKCSLVTALWGMTKG